MSLISVLTSLQKGNELKSSATVKKINVLVNLAAVGIASLSSFGIIAIPAADIMTAGGNIQSFILSSAPAAIALFNAWSHVATSAKIGLPATKK